MGIKFEAAQVVEQADSFDDQYDRNVSYDGNVYADTNSDDYKANVGGAIIGTKSVAQIYGASSKGTIQIESGRIDAIVKAASGEIIINGGEVRKLVVSENGTVEIGGGKVYEIEQAIGTLTIGEPESIGNITVSGGCFYEKNEHRRLYF